MENWNLSDKIFQTTDYYAQLTAVATQDIKEFIRRLKEDIKKEDEQFNDSNLYWLFTKIDSLAGLKLIGENINAHVKSEFYDICKNCGEKYPFKTKKCKNGGVRYDLKDS